MRTTTGVPSIKPAPGYVNEVLVSISDPDLDDDAQAKEAYSFTLLGTEPASLVKNGIELGNLAQLEVMLDDEIPNYDGSLTFTLRETGVNTGVFSAQISATEYQDLANLLDPLGDQEIVELVYHDKMESPDREESFEFRLALRLSPVFFSRDFVPVPGSDLDFDGDPDPIKLTWNIFDPAFNDSPLAEESIPVIGILFKIEMIKSNGDRIVMFDRFNNHLSDILVQKPASLRETGKDTSHFTADLEFRMAGEFDDAEDWQDSELRITYVEDSVFLDDDRDYSGGIVFTGHSAILRTNSTTVHTGQMLYISVQDNDLNVNENERDSFESSVVANDEAILTIETENEDLGGIRTQVFRETGPDTGVFQAGFEVGKDIPVTRISAGDDHVDQATNIVVTYNDRIDSGGRDGEEIELNIPVVSSTGAIQVLPALVGPGTRISVTVVDSDLNQNAAGVDSYEDSGFVTFRTDRAGTGTGSPNIEETGPDTGVFTFDLQLVTEETKCKDDDLSENEFQAVGGEDASIGVCPGDSLFMRYEDANDATGHSTIVSKVIDVSSQDPTFVTEKSNYAVGERIVVTIYDPDANRDPDLADSLRDIRIISPSDKVGRAISALEIGKDSGLFAVAFMTSGANQDSSIFVKPGESIEVRYTDQYPTNFAFEQSSQEFSFVIPVGLESLSETMRPMPPSFEDSGGRIVDEGFVGDQIILSTQVHSQSSDVTQFVTLIEVRDSYGITQLFGWQTGSLDSMASSEMGLAWTPAFADRYSVRTFVIESLENPQILSAVETAYIAILH
jgi:hypothetical protein